MTAHRVYLSPSNQEHNVGVGNYGTEESRMHQLARCVTGKLLRYDGKFISRKSQPDWDMDKVCRDSNDWKSDVHICIHTNAGSSSADGTVAFYGSERGKKLTTCLYQYVRSESPGSDSGILPYPGLYEIRHTDAPCAYLELFFHTNKVEVDDFLKSIDAYAESIVHGLCVYFAVPYKYVTPLDRAKMRRLIDGAPKNDIAWLIHIAQLELAGRG